MSFDCSGSASVSGSGAGSRSQSTRDWISDAQHEQFRRASACDAHGVRQNHVQVRAEKHDTVESESSSIYLIISDNLLLSQCGSGAGHHALSRSVIGGQVCVFWAGRNRILPVN